MWFRIFITLWCDVTGWLFGIILRQKGFQTPINEVEITGRKSDYFNITIRELLWRLLRPVGKRGQPVLKSPFFVVVINISSYFKLTHSLKNKILWHAIEFIYLFSCVCKSFHCSDKLSYNLRPVWNFSWASK